MIVLGPIGLKVDKNTGKPCHYGPGPRVLERFRLRARAACMKKAISAGHIRFAFKQAVAWQELWHNR